MDSQHTPQNWVSVTCKKPICHLLQQQLLYCNLEVLTPYPQMIHRNDKGVVHKCCHIYKIDPQTSLATFCHSSLTPSKMMSQTYDPTPFFQGTKKLIAYRKQLPLFKAKTLTSLYHCTNAEHHETNVYNLGLLETIETGCFYPLFNQHRILHLKT